MRILLASAEDVEDVRSWSGTPFHMHQGLVDAGLDVVTASPLRERFGLPLKAVQAARNALGSTYWSRQREPLIIGGYAAQIREAVERHRPDLVLAPSTIPVARLHVDVPVVTWTDATFAGLVDFYDSYTNLSPRYLRYGHRMERKALERVTLAVYSSEWAARTAIEHYGIPAERTAVVPFGANIADPLVDDAGLGPAQPEDRDTCRLLLVGRGWERKGIDLAVATTERLRARGVPAVLDVVGSTVPAGVSVPPFVTVHGALEKDDPAAAKQMDELYDRATFFVLPTRADCSPVVLAEAQAWCAPVVTTDVGGTTAMVREDRGGWALPLDDFVEGATDRMAEAWNSPALLAELRREARRCYEETLNWGSAVTALTRVLRERGVTSG
jgi:glycosyltransferase involved in cell wall biosynthesis